MYRGDKQAGILSLPQFIIVGVILVVLLLGGTYIAKTYFATHSQKNPTPTSVKKDTQQQEKEAQTKKAQTAEDKKKAEAKQQEEQTKKAEEAAAKKTAEDKQQEAVAAQQQSQTTTPQTAQVTPSTVASTGPGDTLLAVIGAAALAYAGYVFIQSRHELTKSKKLS